MQKSYLMTLYDIAEKDPNVLLLLADSGSGYDELFKKSFPERVLDFGIAEENMVAAAAGLASCGKIPFVYTAGAFLAYRSVEFIRDDVCFQNRNVKLIGMGTGLAWSTLGATHHTTEDLGILRAIPNLLVLCPSCPSMVEKCIRTAYKHQGPVYVRIGMGGEKELYSEPYEIDSEKSMVLSDGSDITVFSCGAITAEVLEAADILSAKGISVKIIDMFSVSPIDAERIVSEAKSGRPLFTVEEHSITGGIGSAVAEVLAENRIPADFHRIGLDNSFACGYGTHHEVRMQNGLDSESIATKIYNCIGEK